MAALVKRHWISVSLLVFVVALLIGWVLRIHLFAGVREALADTSETPPQQQPTMDPVDYGKVQQIRQELCLTNFDLAVMGCSQEAATNVLTALSSWYQSHRAELVTAEQSVLEKQRQLHEAVKNVNVGPRSEGNLAQMPTLQQNAQAATQQRNAIVESAVQALSATLTAEQNQLWLTARANAATTSHYRYVPNITQAQLKVVQSSPDPLADQVLSADQKQAFITAAANSVQFFSGVTAAEAVVLPVPNEMKPPSTTEATTHLP